LLEPEQMARLVYNPKIPMTVITRNQLEAWQSSALTALALEVDKDFVIKPNVTVQTKEGPKVVSQALLVSGSRASGNAKFSFGVHQCLHARLNELRKSASDDSPTPLTNQLKGLENTFYLDPENQIIYSSTSKDLMDDYEEGELLAVTGTAGSIKEREEAGEQFGSDKGNMAFIDVPRHRGQKREDLPVALAKNEEAQKQKILASVRVSLSKNPPQAILLVCENDTESQALHDFLKKNLSEAKRSKLTRISARTSLDTEAKHVKEGAGLPGAITVSTAMLGRGTDIKLHKAAQMVNGVPSQTLTTSGLSVIGTYLPRERDYEQIIGRAGRFGAVGESRIILDTERVKRQIGADVLPTEFYTATESYLKLQQKHMDTFAQQQRVVKYAVGDFRKALTDQFFDKFYQPLAASGQKDLLLEPWQKFFDKTDKQWNETWPNVVLELAQKPLNVVEVKRLLTEYEDLVKQEWQGMRDALKAQITSGKIVCAEGEAKVDETIPAITTSIHIDDKREARLQSSHRELKEESLRTIVASKYDPAFVGRAVIYTSWLDGVKAFWANIQSARRGETPWFPNLKAYQNGNMSSSQLLFGTWGSPLPSKSTLPDVDLHQKSVPVSVPEELPLTLSTRVLLDKLSCSSSILKKHDVVEDEHDVVEDPIVLETTSDKTPLKQRLSQLKGDLNQNTENDIDQSHY